MNRANLVRVVLIVLSALAPGAAKAQQALEIIPLRYRTVEQVLPALQPLVEPGGTLSGSRGQLFLRASPANVAEIRRALDAIDRPSRRLTILVRHDDAGSSARREISASGTISSSGSRVTVTGRDSRSDTAERVDQRVQVLEGGRAFIAAGVSTAISDRATGFEVTPRLSGDRVTLEIAAQREVPGSRPGSVQSQRTVSTVSARLGDWIELAGADSARNTGTSAAVRSRRVWVKVEEAN